MDQLACGMLRNTREGIKQDRQRMEEEIAQVVEELEGVYQDKAELYDKVLNLWDKQALGDVSFATNLYECTCRIVEAYRSLSPTEEDQHTVDDKLSDLLVYGILWKAWRRIQKEDQIVEDKERILAGVSRRVFTQITLPEDQPEGYTLPEAPAEPSKMASPETPTEPTKKSSFLHKKA